MHARMADTYWAKGQLAEAREHFISELRASPGDLDVMLDLGELLVEMGDAAAAAEKFRQVLELSPEECTAHFHLGQLCLEHDDLAGALERFRRVLKNERTFTGAHVKIAQIYHRQRDESEALFHANCELAQQAGDEGALLELGNLFMDIQQLASAEVAFNRVLSMNPKNAAARHNLAVTLLLAGRIDEGIEQAKHALRIQPKYMLAMHNLSLAYITKKDFPRARCWLREAMDIAPDDPQLRQLQVRLRVAVVVHRVRGVLRRFFTRRGEGGERMNRRRGEWANGRGGRLFLFRRRFADSLIRRFMSSHPPRRELQMTRPPRCRRIALQDSFQFNEQLHRVVAFEQFTVLSRGDDGFANA